jgi:hypothetical protein
VSGALDCVCGLLIAWIYPRALTGPLWPTVQWTLIGAFTFALTLSWRRAPERIVLLLLQLNFASSLVMALMSAWAMAKTPESPLAFQPVKLSLIVIAILAPTLKLGVKWIAIFTLAALVEFLVMPERLQDNVTMADTLFVAVYTVTALALLFYRQRQLLLERVVAEARADRITAERLARVSLTVRDLSGTPLQTLTTGVSLLEHGATAEQQTVLRAMSRALGRLEGLRHTLRALEDESKSAGIYFEE